MALDNFRRSSRTKLNFTDRHSFAHADVGISVNPTESPLTVRVAHLSLPSSVGDDAQISIDAYRSKTGHFERLDFGSAGKFKNGGGVGTSRPLSRITSAEGLSFRLKIAQTDGRLIAEADGLRAIEESDERFVDDLFPVIPKSLDGELWRVFFSPDGPELHVERSLDQEGIFLWTLPTFQALVLPAALRQVAERLIRTREAQEDWHERWRVFLSGLHIGFREASEPDGEEDLPDDDQIDALAVEVAGSFARKFDLLKAGINALREGVAE